MTELKESSLDIGLVDLNPPEPMLPSLVDAGEPVVFQRFANQFDDPDLRQKVLSMEAFMLEQPQVEIPVKHHFCSGLYAREITAPAGVIMTGMVHKTEHLNIMSKGEVSVMTEDGMVRFKAPCTFVSKPGTKRIGYVHEEMVWTTIHATTETDLTKIEADLATRSYEDADIGRFMIEMKEN
jgi:hypothetical protein